MDKIEIYKYELMLPDIYGKAGNKDAPDDQVILFPTLCILSWVYRVSPVPNDSGKGITELHCPEKSLPYAPEEQ